MIEPLLYRAGYKYQVAQDYIFTLPDDFIPTYIEVETDYLWYDGTYTLIVKKGYAWDGPSGPTWDTPSFMRGSAGHDGLYQFMRLGYLDKNTYRLLADRFFYETIRQDGMNWCLATLAYYMVRWFARRAVMINPNPILRAP